MYPSVEGNRVETRGATDYLGVKPPMIARKTITTNFGGWRNNYGF